MALSSRAVGKVPAKVTHWRAYPTIPRLGHFAPVKRRSHLLGVRIQDIVQYQCIQHIVQCLNRELENPHEIRLFEARWMFLVGTLKETYCTMS